MNMNITFRRDLNRNYLVLSDTGETERSYEVKMLMENPAKHLLALSCRTMDGKTQLCYEMTSRQNLAAVFEGRQMKRRDIRVLLEGLCEAAQTCRRYLIIPEKLCFSPQQIYLDPSDGEPEFLYVPGERQERPEYPLRELAEFILKRLDHGDRTAVDLGYEFYARSAAETSVPDAGVRELLRRYPADEKDEAREPARETARQAADEPAQEEWDGRDLPWSGRSGSREPAGFPQAKTTRQGGKTARQGGGSRAAGDKAAGDGFQGRGPHREELPMEEAGDDASKDAAAGRTGSSKKRKRGKRKPGRAERRRQKLIRRVVLISFAIAALYLFCVWFFRMDLTSAGGLAFLMIAVTWLTVSGISQKKERKPGWADETYSREKEDAFLEKMMEEEWKDDPFPDPFTPPALLRSRDGAAPAQGPVKTEDAAEQAGRSGRAEQAGSGRAEQMAGKREQGKGAPSEGTRYLIAPPAGASMLMSLHPDAYPDLVLEKRVTLIGKNPDQVDICIDSEVVSRVHARIEKDKEKYFVTDLSSLNGTFVNQERLLPMQCQALENGDRVSFAGVDYRMRVS